MKILLFALIFAAAPLISYAEDTQSGKDLFGVYCSACHSLSPPPKAAPPVRGIIRQYYERYENRREFVKRIGKFVLEPEMGEVICAPAKERFGSMPKLPVSAEQVEKIASWMWDDKSLWPMRYR